MLKASSDRKTQAYPTQRNTFGTLPGRAEVGGTCPHATLGEGGCRHVKKGRKTATCYVDNLVRAYPGVKGVLQHNTDELLTASHERRVELFITEFERFYSDEIRRDKCKEFWYRVHWSGDVPDEGYAWALREAIEASPFLRFWGYTRSLFSVPILAGTPRLRWYISADDVNFDEAWAVYQKYLVDKHVNNIHFCYMGKEKKPGYEKALIGCPVDDGRLELQGGCHKCKLCLKGVPIHFAT
jgi:hypothetical protein